MRMEDVVKAEVELYRAMPPRDEGQDCLEWWKEVGSPALKIMKRAARGHLSLQANSCAAERLFSTLGLMISALRSELDPYTVQMLLFVRMNRDLYV